MPAVVISLHFEGGKEGRKAGAPTKNVSLSVGRTDADGRCMDGRVRCLNNVCVNNFQNGSFLRSLMDGEKKE